MKTARKISMASIGIVGKLIALGDGNPENPGLKDGEQKLVATIAGVAKKAKKGESDYGEFTKFIGEFVAVNRITGEQFKSSTCFLNGDLLDQVESAIQSVDKATGEVYYNDVEFSANVFVVRDNSIETMFFYSTQPIRKVAASNALLTLINEIAEVEKIDIAIVEPKQLTAETPAPEVKAPEKGKETPAKANPGKGKGK